MRKGVARGGYDGERTAFEDAKWPQFTEGTVQKCTFCAHRVDQGLEPACVVTCPTDARIFGDLEDEESKPSVLIRERDGRPRAGGGGHEAVRLLPGAERSSRNVQQPLIARNEFLIGYTRQREWAWLITAAFFFGSVGAGLFFVSYFVGFRLGAVAGLLSSPC